MTRNEIYKFLEKNNITVLEKEEIDFYRFGHSVYGFRLKLLFPNGKIHKISNCVGNTQGHRWRSNTLLFRRILDKF